MSPFRVILGLTAAGLLFTSGIAVRAGLGISNRDLGTNESWGAALPLTVSIADSRLTEAWGAILASEVELERKSLKSSEKWTDFSKRLSSVDPSLKIAQPISNAPEATVAMAKAKALLSKSQDGTKEMLDGIVTELQPQIEALAANLIEISGHARSKPLKRIEGLIVFGRDYKTSKGLNLVWVSSGGPNQGFWTTPSEISRADWKSVATGLPAGQWDKPPTARKPERGDFQAAARQAALAGLNEMQRKTAEARPEAIEGRVSAALDQLYKRAMNAWESQQGGNEYEGFPEGLINVSNKTSINGFVSGLQQDTPALKSGWSFRLPSKQEWKVLTSDKAPKDLDNPMLSEWLLDSEIPIGSNWRSLKKDPKNQLPPAEPGTVGFRILLAGPPPP